MLRSLARSGAALALLVALSLAASAQPGNSFDISGTTVGAPTANLPLFLSTPGSCSLAPSAEPYDETPFTVAPGGTYQFSVTDPIDVGFGDDTIIIVYETAFDPNDACANFVGIGNETPGSGLTLDLEAGTDYVLVVGGFFGSEDTYTIRVSGPEACTIDAPLVISAFSTTETTVDNTSSDSAVDLSACTVAAYDGRTERVTAAEDPTDVLAPMASRPVALAAPAGPGAVVVAAADLGVGSTVGDAVGSVVAAVVYDETGSIYVATDGTKGECGNGPDVSPCNSLAGQEAIGAAMAALFGGSVGVEEEGPIDLSITVAPNPTAHRATVAFGLAEPGDVRVSLHDALGREVAVLAAGPYSAGRHEATIEADALPAGVYIVRIAGSDVATVPFTIAR